MKHEGDRLITVGVPIFAAIVAIGAAFLAENLSPDSLERVIFASLAFVIVFLLGDLWQSRRAWRNVDALQKVIEIERVCPKFTDQLSRNFESIDHTSRKNAHEWLAKAVRHSVEDLLGRTKSLRNQSFEIPADLEASFNEFIAKECLNSIFAMSVRGATFWNSEDGSDYLRVQEQAIKERNVKISRIFVAENDEDLESLEVIAKTQNAKGIKTAILDIREPHLMNLHPRDIGDFIIIDSEAVRTGSATNGLLSGMRKAQLSLDPAFVRTSERTFNECWKHSKKQPAEFNG